MFESLFKLIDSIIGLPDKGITSKENLEEVAEVFDNLFGTDED
jgi:hypothetical protein